MKKLKIIPIAVMAFLFTSTIVFFSCQKQTVKSEQSQNTDLSKGVYLTQDLIEENPAFEVEPELKKQVEALAIEYHNQFVEEGKFDVQDDNLYKKGGDDPQVSCCELIRTREQNNPWWVGAELEDRASQNATFILVYLGFQHSNNLLVTQSTWNISTQKCGDGTRLTYWNGVPIPPGISLHSTCPNIDVRAEHYLFIKYQNIPDPILCNSSFKIFPLRATNNNHPPCQ